MIGELVIGELMIGELDERKEEIAKLVKFCYEVKRKFGDQPEDYKKFMKIMKDFKEKSIDTPDTIVHISHLFRDHPDLMVGFNVFLPPGYEIKVESKKAVSLFSLW